MAGFRAEEDLQALFLRNTSLIEIPVRPEQAGGCPLPEGACGRSSCSCPHPARTFWSQPGAGLAGPRGLGPAQGAPPHLPLKHCTPISWTLWGDS